MICQHAAPGLAQTSLCWACAGVTWFEVDKPDVLSAKHKALSAAGASFSSDSNAGAAVPVAPYVSYKFQSCLARNS